MNTDLHEVPIDGAVPRSGAERCEYLLTEAFYYLGTDTSGRRNIRYNALREDIAEALLYENKYEFWHEIEDDIIELISDCLPSGWICELAPD